MKSGGDLLQELVDGQRETGETGQQIGLKILGEMGQIRRRAEEIEKRIRSVFWLIAFIFLILPVVFGFVYAAFVVASRPSGGQV